MTSQNRSGPASTGRGCQDEVEERRAPSLASAVTDVTDVIVVIHVSAVSDVTDITSVTDVIAEEPRRLRKGEGEVTSGGGVGERLRRSRGV